MKQGKDGEGREDRLWEGERGEGKIFQTITYEYNLSRIRKQGNREGREDIINIKFAMFENTWWKRSE
jgi:hypothetical protein